MARTFDSVMAEMTSYVLARLPGQDTRIGTALREAFLAPMASILVDAYNFTDTVTANQTIAAPEAISSTAMDSTAANFGLARSAGIPSSGVVNFYRFQVPALPISIPAGTVVSASGSGNSIGFVTMASYSLSALSPQDPISGAYFVAASVKANASGTSGNVAAGAITHSSLSGIDQISNPNPTSGGLDSQTNTQLADLIKARAQGNLGTLGGYKALIQENFSLLDLAIVTPTDPEAERAQFGGELDVIIVDSNSIGSQETPFSNTSTFTPLFLPLMSVQSIVGFLDVPSLIVFNGPLVTSNVVTMSVNNVVISTPFVTSNAVTLANLAALIATRPGVTESTYSSPGTIAVSPAATELSGLTVLGGAGQATATITLGTPTTPVTLAPVIDYTVVIDTFSPYSRSYREHSRIELHPTMVLFPFSVLTILYTNNQDVRTIQRFLDDDANHVLGADVLVKLAVDTPLNVFAEIYVIPGYDSATVHANCVAAVTGMFASLLLGVDMTESKIISVMSSIAGVHYVDAQTMVLAMANDQFQTEIQNVAAGKQERLTLANLTINVAG